MAKITHKLFLLILSIFVCCHTCKADVFPLSCDKIPKQTIGLYQADRRIEIYSKPDIKAKVLYDSLIDYSKYNDSKTDTTFAVMIPKKELAFLFVTNISDDEEWVEIIYDKQNNKKGWIYKNDDFQFMPWHHFINLYGRKYGLSQLIKTPSEYKNVYSAPDRNSQILGKIQGARAIRLTAIEGYWMLVTAVDYDGEIITGYIQWRDDEGNIFIFPVLK